MSPATAICFTLSTIGINNIYSNKKPINNLSQFFLGIVSIISLVSTISYLLLIPSGHKSFFLETMAIHTSTLFLLVSAVTLREVNFNKLHPLLQLKLMGTQTLYRLIPLVILFPIIAGVTLLYITNHHFVDTDFSIATYTVIYILFGLTYTYLISKNLNKVDLKRSNLEKALKAINQDLKQFKDGLDRISIVAITDKKGRITYVNDQFCKVSQYSRGELLGNTHAILNSGYHPKRFFVNLWKTIASGNIWEGEIKNKAKDGSFYWVNTAIIPFKDDKNRVQQYLAIRQDVTKRKEAEELMTSNYVKKLESQNKELEQFAYVASHDLQEPLRTISSFSSLLEKEFGDQLDARGLQYMAFIQESSVRMSSLIKSLLDYSRLGNSKQMEWVNCSQLLEEVQRDLAQNIVESEAEIILESLPEKIQGHPVELRMLFQNLLSNAIKFRRKEQKPYITISYKKSKRGWKFSVEDNGIGIPEQYRERIFTIFQRLHNREEYEGTGIGLTNCRKIVELHGGNIWIESSVKGGCIFYFTIKTRS
jgi:PAS domain S-box-containing protein